MNNTTCVYMDGNLDSFAAAWTLWRTFPNAHFVPQLARVLPHDIDGRDVFVMGCDIPLASVLAMAPFTNTLTVFGHEETFIDQLNNTTDLPDNVQVVANTQQSLCMLVWHYFNGSTPPPELFHYLEDRAIWRFQSPDSRAVCAALMGYPFAMDIWDTLIYGTTVEQLTVEGNVVLRRLARDIEFIVRSQKRRVNIGGYDVPVINVNPQIAVDTGVLIAKGEPFAACYWDTPEGRRFELISAPNGLNVGELAQAFGGHGQPREASFVVGRDHPLALA